MQKQCMVCLKPYETSHRNQKTCSKACGYRLRSKEGKYFRVRQVPVYRENEETPTTSTTPPVSSSSYIGLDSLPSVELLPAEYLKRCSDYWAYIISDSEKKIL